LRELTEDLDELSLEECECKGIKHSSEDDNDERFFVEPIVYLNKTFGGVEFIEAAILELVKRRNK